MANHESNCQTERETLKRVLVEEYEEKVFYFCLKKTGNSTEAEDLASDILLNCIMQLDKGNTPAQFAAWVWKIARNRYSVWAGRKHRYAESVSGEDIGELEIADETAGLEKTMVRQDELRLLRRELAFISSAYRDIVTAYYMVGRRIREIAQSLHLPEGTVMAKLHRARTKLKEGMDMAREFGTRSYNPEYVNFIASGSQPSGLPWTAIQRMIPMNILCEAHNNRSIKSNKFHSPRTVRAWQSFYLGAHLFQHSPNLTLITGYHKTKLGGGHAYIRSPIVDSPRHLTACKSLGLQAVTSGP